MAQHDYVIANQGFPAFRSDLNNGLAAIVSNNSGATEPSTMFAHQIWVDTAANPSILKIRNADNDAWITIGSIDQTGDTFTMVNLKASGPVVFNDAGADVDFRVEGDTDANLLFVDASADNVGIGTNTPATKVHLAINDGNRCKYSTTRQLVIPFEGVNIGGISCRAYSTGTTEVIGGEVLSVSDGAWSSTSAPTRLIFNTTATSSTTATERARITSGGGVQTPNTSTDPHNFGVNRNDGIAFDIDNANTTSPYGANIRFTGATPNNGTNYFLNCSDTTNTKATILSNGGLANFSANNVNLSDARVKKDVADLGSQWNCLKEWNLVEFRYNEQSDDVPKNYGVIAQQIQEHCPEVVTIFQQAREAVDAQEAVLDEEGNVVEPAVEAKPAQEERIGVREQQMLWMAVKALQEAMERIETLEASNTALEARIAALEGQ